METLTSKRINKINTINSEKLPIVLLNLLRMVWSVEEIIEEKIECHKVKSTKNLKHKDHIKEVKEWFGELGEDIIEDYRTLGIRELILNELLDYLELKNDILSRDIIEGHCMSSNVFWDINKVKNHLIWWVNELEEHENLKS